MKDLKDLAKKMLEHICLRGHKPVVSKRMCTIVCTVEVVKENNDAQTECVYQVEFCKHRDPKHEDWIFVHMSKLYGDVELFKKIV